MCESRTYRLRAPSAQSLALWLTTISAQWMQVQASTSLLRVEFYPNPDPGPTPTPKPIPDTCTLTPAGAARQLAAGIRNQLGVNTAASAVAAAGRRALGLVNLGSLSVSQPPPGTSTTRLGQGLARKRETVISSVRERESRGVFYVCVSCAAAGTGCRASDQIRDQGQGEPSRRTGTLEMELDSEHGGRRRQRPARALARGVQRRAPQRRDLHEPRRARRGALEFMVLSTRCFASL